VNSGIVGSVAKCAAVAAGAGSSSPDATGCSFSIIWLNSEYGNPAAGWAGGAGKGAGENVFEGTALHQTARGMVSRTKSWTKVPWRKRTSVFEG
jgi:hypothetical protein